MPNFKVPCPSCEHQVLITGANKIGQKVDCPKCKYRFKVEEPKEAPAEEPKAEKGKKKAAAPATSDAANKKKKKTMIAVVVGVVAVGVLAAVGFAVMGGGDKNKNKGSGGGYVGGAKNTGNQGDGKGNSDGKGSGGGTDPKKDQPKPNPNKPSTKEASNLLPAETVALYRIDLEKLRQTPVSIMFDPGMLQMFQASMGIEASDVDVYHHAFVGATRYPFGVIRLREPTAEKDIIEKMNLVREKGDPRSSKKIATWTLHAFKSNPFANGVANALAHRSVFADLYDKGVVTPPPPEIPLGVCVYDTQHILIGQYAGVEAFLKSLDEKEGYPKFQSVASTSENPVYLSIKPRLKKVFKDLGGESAAPPIVVYAEEYAQGQYDTKLFKADLQPIAAVLDPILNRTLYVGANLLSFNPKQVSGTMRMVLVSDAAVLDVVREQLTPGLDLTCQALTQFLHMPVEFRPPGYTGPIQPKTGTGTDPTMPPGGGPGPGGGPRPGPGGSGQGPPGVGTPPGVGGQPGVGTPPGVGGQPGASGQPPRGGSGMGPPTAAGSGQGPPTAVGSGMGPPAVGVGGQPSQFPTNPGTGQPGTNPYQQLPSYISLSSADQDIIIGIELNWTEDVYRRLIAPRILGLASTFKGKMAVFASDLSYHGLAAVTTKLGEKAMMPAYDPSRPDERLNFPRGTVDRQLTDQARMGLKYPPHTRVSLFADLLPYLGNRNNLIIDRNLEWFNEKNMAAAEAWVPELLVPSYPQTSWRATSPFVAEGRILGGTNYVAIAGIGMDAARYDPSNPEHAKKVGIVGYDWGSKNEDIKDGRSNTIFLMQTPPGLSQPWIAGGGATVRGLDENNPMRGWSHTYGTPNGQPGTYALMADNSVRFIPEKINPKVLLAMSTRAGGESLADLDAIAPPVNPVKKKPIEEPKPDPMVVMDPKKLVDPKEPPKDPGPVPPTAKFEVAPEPREKK